MKHCEWRHLELRDGLQQFAAEQHRTLVPALVHVLT